MNKQFKGLRHDALNPGTDKPYGDFHIAEYDKLKKLMLRGIKDDIAYVLTADGLAEMTFGEYLKLRKGGDQMNELKFQLGNIVRDELSGFTGTVIGRAQYAYETSSYLVVSGDLRDHGKSNEVWLPESRLTIKD